MDIDYKCKINIDLGCSDMCCKFCLGATECKYACKGNPIECDMAVQYPNTKE